jgi:hypothetical protein
LGANAAAPGATVVDLGCGSGFPITEVLVAEGLNVYAVDAVLSFVHAFQRNFPNIPVACEAVEHSTFFDLTFDGVVAWGLIFLLSPEAQAAPIRKNRRHTSAGWPPAVYVVRGTIGVERCDDRIRVTIPWSRRIPGQLLAVGLAVANEYDDEGWNHSFDAFKPRALNSDPATRR